MDGSPRDPEGDPAGSCDNSISGKASRVELFRNDRITAVDVRRREAAAESCSLRDRPAGGRGEWGALLAGDFKRGVGLPSSGQFRSRAEWSPRGKARFWLMCWFLTAACGPRYHHFVRGSTTSKPCGRKRRAARKGNSCPYKGRRTPLSVPERPAVEGVGGDSLIAALRVNGGADHIAADHIQTTTELSARGPLTVETLEFPSLVDVTRSGSEPAAPRSRHFPRLRRIRTQVKPSLMMKS